MTTLVTADLHLAENPRDAYRFKFLEETLPTLVKEHNATRVLVLGDLTESKDLHRATLVNRIVDGFTALAEAVDVIVLKGNHDYVSEDVPFYRFLGHLPRVRWINEPTEIKLRGLGNCLFLPYTKDTGDWADWLLNSTRYDWYFCHQTFGGADLGNDYKVESGVDPRATFGKAARVISGDVHVPQKLGPVTYVGSPYRIDFGDDFEPRVLVIDGDEMESVKVPGPQKRLVTVSGRNPLAGLRMSGHPLAALLPTIEPGDIVKVRVNLPSKSELTRAAVRTEVRAWAEEVGAELWAVEVKSAAPTTEEAERQRPQRSDEELVRAYAKKMKQGDAVIAAGMKIVEETL